LKAFPKIPTYKNTWWMRLKLWLFGKRYTSYDFGEKDKCVYVTVVKMGNKFYVTDEGELDL